MVKGSLPVSCAGAMRGTSERQLGLAVQQSLSLTLHAGNNHSREPGGRSQAGQSGSIA